MAFRLIFKSVLGKSGRKKAKKALSGKKYVY